MSVIAVWSIFPQLPKDQNFFHKSTLKHILHPPPLQHRPILEADELPLPVPAVVLKLPHIYIVILVKYLALHKIPSLEQTLEDVALGVRLLALAVALVVAVLPCRR